MLVLVDVEVDVDVVHVDVELDVDVDVLVDVLVLPFEAHRAVARHLDFRRARETAMAPGQQSNSRLRVFGNVLETSR